MNEDNILIQLAAKKLTLAGMTFVLLSLNPSLKATSEIPSFLSKEIQSKAINLKQDKAQNHQKTFIGNWDALSTLKDPQGQTVNSQIANISEQKIVLKNETSGGVFTLTRKL